MSRRTRRCRGQTYLWCWKCLRYLPPGAFHKLSPKTRGTSQYQYLCRSCTKAYQREWRATRKAAPTQRRCPICERRRPPAAFAANGGIRSWCRDCRDGVRQWRLALRGGFGPPSHEEPGHEVRMREHQERVAAHYCVHQDDPGGNTVRRTLKEAVA